MTGARLERNMRLLGETGYVTKMVSRPKVALVMTTNACSKRDSKRYTYLHTYRFSVLIPRYANYGINAI